MPFCGEKKYDFPTLCAIISKIRILYKCKIITFDKKRLDYFHFICYHIR